MKFQSVWLIICFAYLQLRLGSITGTFCSDYARRVKHKFSLIRHCQRSNKTVIAFQNFQTVEQCADYARQSRGLAFNFGLASRKRRRMCRRYSNFIQIIFFLIYWWLRTFFQLARKSGKNQIRLLKIRMNRRSCSIARFWTVLSLRTSRQWLMIADTTITVSTQGQVIWEYQLRRLAPSHSFSIHCSSHQLHLFAIHRSICFPWEPCQLHNGSEYVFLVRRQLGAYFIGNKD